MGLDDNLLLIQYFWKVGWASNSWIRQNKRFITVIDGDKSHTWDRVISLAATYFENASSTPRRFDKLCRNASPIFQPRCTEHVCAINHFEFTAQDDSIIHAIKTKIPTCVKSGEHSSIASHQVFLSCDNDSGYVNFCLFLRHNSYSRPASMKKQTGNSFSPNHSKSHSAVRLERRKQKKWKNPPDREWSRILSFAPLLIYIFLPLRRY